MSVNGTEALTSVCSLGPPLTDGAYFAKGSAAAVFLVDGTKRHISSWDVFVRYGFNQGAIRTLSAEELAAIPDGADIT